jgi:PnrA-like ABC transporter substrate-binding protein
MSVRRAVLIGAAAVAASVVLAGCAPAPDAGSGATEADGCVRMVTNSGGLEDRSFNQSTWEGLQQAEDELGVEADALVSTGETDLEPNVQQAVESGCELVVTVGYELAQVTLDAAAANPEVSFAIVDESVDADNVAIHVGRIKERDARVQRGGDHLGGSPLIDAAAEIVAAHPHDRDRQGPDPAMLHANSRLSGGLPAMIAVRRLLARGGRRAAQPSGRTGVPSGATSCQTPPKACIP